MADLPRLASLLRRIADRLDYHGAPKLTGFSFTFETGEGIRWRHDGKGCPVAYLGDEQYERAHAEADSNSPSSRTTVVVTNGDATEITLDGRGWRVRDVPPSDAPPPGRGATFTITTSSEETKRHA